MAAFRDRVTALLPKAWRTSLYRRVMRHNAKRNQSGRETGLVTLHGVKLQVDPDTTDDQIMWALVHGTYEGAEMKMTRMYLDKDDVVMELGAGLGFISTYCAMRIGDDRVHTFEANPLLEPSIRHNYAINGVEPDLKIGLLGQGTGEATMHVSDSFWSTSTQQVPGSRPVKTRRLDLTEEIRRIRPTFLIMDIEGGEIDIIDAIEFDTIEKIAMEVHPQKTGQAAIDGMDARLREAGFQREWAGEDDQHVFYARASTTE
ncbi:MAG: FkbM family methyltransferase [Planctomycetota bacterium]